MLHFVFKAFVYVGAYGVPVWKSEDNLPQQTFILSFYHVVWRCNSRYNLLANVLSTELSSGLS